MLWKNCQGVDSQRLASTYAYCSENLSDLGDRKKKRWKKGEKQRRKKDRKEHQCEKGQHQSTALTRALTQTSYETTLDGSSKTCRSSVSILSSQPLLNLELRCFQCGRAWPEL